MIEERGSARDIWLVQMHSLDVLREFVGACDSAGIVVLPVKGILSARTLYADISERIISDVDVRVIPEDVSRVEQLAKTRGWKIVHRTWSYDNLVLQIDGRAVDVEGHAGPPGASRLTIANMLERSVTNTAVYGFRAQIPEVHDHALLLIINAFKDHMAHAMAWAIADLSRVVRSPAIDWNTLITRAEETSASTILWLVAEWMERVMADEQWSAFRARLGQPSRDDYVRAHRWFESLGSYGDFPLRILARFCGDSRSLWVGAAARMAAWQLEVLASRLGATPYRRGVFVPPEPTKKR